MKTAHIDRCKRLRKDETYTEANLWHILRNRQFNGVKFRRQHPIGRYILDFYCPEHKLGIEADGGGHCDDVGKKRDEARTKTLSEYGVRILRFSDLDILNNIEGVYEVICKETERDNAPSPHPSPLKRGEVDNV